MTATVSREEWLAARTALQVQEDEAWVTIERVNAARRALPKVEITKEYTFASPDGPKTLLDLFEGRDQLIIYHFMFHPDWEQGCPYCSLNVDGFGHLAHLNARKTTLAVVSRAPLSKITPFKERMGWTFPWYSSEGSEFNQDFYATLDGTADVANYMYKDKETMDAQGEYYFEKGDQGGRSVFVREGARIFHTYTSYGTFPDILDPTANYLDLTPLGRVEAPVKHHDRYSAGS